MEMNNVNISVKELANLVMDHDNPDKLLKKFNDNIQRYLFENLINIGFRTNSIPFCKFSKNYIICQGKIDQNGIIIPVLNHKDYFEKAFINESCSEGISDIKLLDKEEGKYALGTCKYSDKKYPIRHFDLEKISKKADKNDITKGKYILFVICKDKNNISKGRQDEISEDVVEYFDLKDLEKYWDNIKYNLKKLIENNYILNENNYNIIPHFGQLLFINKTLELKKLNKSEVCWGARCRFGKSICSYLLPNLHIKIYGNVNSLIICERPSETKKSFKKYFWNDKKFNLIIINSVNDINKIEFKNNNIVIISDQLLKRNSNSELISILTKLKYDYIYKDEDHVGGCTEKSNDVESKLKSENTMVIPMTATFNKSKFLRSTEEILTWNVHDDIDISQGNFNNVKERFGEDIVCKTLDMLKYDNNILEENIINHYKNVPKLCYMTTNWHPELLNLILSSIKDTNEGFDIDRLWDCDNSFRNEQSVHNLLDHIGGNGINKNIINIYKRINNHSLNNGNKYVNLGIKPCIQLWFLPQNNIEKVSNNLETLMSNHRVFKNYKILKINCKDPQTIKLKEGAGLEENLEEILKTCDKGLILLAGSMLNLGISLPSCDIVLKLHNKQSADENEQQDSRCMTESVGKKYGYVFDLNPHRILSKTFGICDQINMVLACPEAGKYCIEHNLIEIDSDLFDTIDNTEKYNKIYKKLNDVYKEFIGLNKESYKKLMSCNISNISKDIYKSLSNDDKKELLKYKTDGKSSIKIKESLTDTNIGDGKVKKPIDGGSDGGGSDGGESDVDSNTIQGPSNEEIYINIINSIFQNTIPMLIFLTIRELNIDSDDILTIILNNIKTDPVKNRAFTYMSNLWWGINDPYNILFIIFNHLKINKYNIYIIKDMINNLKNILDQPAELLEFMISNLQPKQVEKRRDGQVYTPPEQISDMHDTYDICIKEGILNDNSIWSNPDATFLDLCCAMGQFSVQIYHRLMHGLKDWQPDELLRKQHILSNMIYMIEKNEADVEMCKMLFNYEINIWTGDYINDFNLEDVWPNIYEQEGFMHIHTNPPYQKENKKNPEKMNSGSPFFQEFIKKSLDDLKPNGYLLAIHPPTWKRPSSPRMSGLQIEYIIKQELLYLNTSDKTDKFIGASPKVDYYLLRKNPESDNNTYIVSEFEDKKTEGLIKINKESNFLPNNLNTESIGIIEKMLDKQDIHNSLKIIYKQVTGFKKKSGHLKDNKCEKYKYPIIHQVNKSGLIYQYSDIKHPTQNLFKIIMPFKSDPYKFVKSLYYDKGVNGISDNMMYMEVSSEEEANIIINLLKSNIFKYIYDVCGYSTGQFQQIEYKILNQFKIPMNILSINDIFKFYNLNDKEINEVNKTSNNKIKELNNMNVKELIELSEKLNIDNSCITKYRSRKGPWIDIIMKYYNNIEDKKID